MDKVYTDKIIFENEEELAEFCTKITTKVVDKVTAVYDYLINKHCDDGNKKEEETVFETKTDVDFNDRDAVAQLIVEYDLLVHKLLYQVAQLKRELAEHNVKTY